MKKIGIYLAAAATLLSSCNFEENCPSRGYLEVVIKSVPKEYKKIQRNIMYFPSSNVKEQLYFKSAEEFPRDTLQRECPAGLYDMIIYNKGNNILRDPKDNNLSSLLLECPTIHDNGADYIMEEQEFICADVEKDVLIEQWKTTRLDVNMKPLVKKIELEMNVVDNQEQPFIASIKGNLSGVLTQKYIDGRNGTNYATQRFSTDFKKSDKKVSKSIYVFGLNTSVSNILTLIGTDEEGKEYTTEIDISKMVTTINDDNSDGVKIKIDIFFRKELHVVEVTIAGWENIIESSSTLHSLE